MTKAAVFTANDQPLELMDLNLMDPQPGEVRIEAIGSQRRGCGGQLRHAMPSGQCRRVTGGAMGRDLAQQVAKP